MRNAQAAVEVGESTDFETDALLNEFVTLSKHLTIEKYLLSLERFVDQARVSLKSVPDAKERARLRQGYEQVVEFALNLVMKARY